MSSCMTGAAAAEVAIAVEDHPTVNTCTSLVTHTAGRLSRTLRSNRKSHNLSRSRLGSLRDLAPTHQSSRTTLDGSLDRPARPRRSWSVRRIRAKTKKVFSECLLGRWKDFDRETERAFQTQENIAYGFVKKIMAFFCFVHFCVACVISALSQVSIYPQYDTLTIVSYAVVWGPAVFLLLWTVFRREVAPAWIESSVALVNGWFMAYEILVRGFLCEHNVEGYTGPKCTYYTELHGSVIFYSLVGPALLISVYRINRLIFLIAAVVCCSLLMKAFQASGKVIASATLYGLGFYIWIILLAYWTEKNHRYTFLLKYELNNQMQATHHAKSAEQREAASKRRFVSYIFHEIRVPFNTAVLGFHNMEDEGAFKGLDESQKGSLDAIRSSFTMMESVLNDVLDFQKMEEGKFELQSRPFDLAAAVRASAYAFASTAYEKNIDLSTTIDARVLAFGATVLGDDIRYRQVLNNFISNALKFTPRDGRVAISVMVVNASGVTKDSKREVTIRTEVKDSGVGISKEDQEKMFQPYFQINSWGLQGGKGTGLGLAICKHIIQLAGGTCGVESTMGEGSTFWSEISLPLYDSTASIHSATSHQSIGSLAAHTTHVDRASSVLSVTPMTPPPGVPRSLHVLVVDDDKITRMMMSKLLKQMGHTFEIATDGQEALDIICNEPDVDVEPGGNGAIPIIVINPMESLNISNPGTTTSLTTLPAAPLPTPPLSPSTSRHTSRFNVILMDNQMPRLTGAEAVRALRERGIVTPVVGITGNALKEDQELFIQAGADLVITKPLKKEKLVNTLRLIV